MNQLGGIQSGLPDFMINTHHLESKKEAEQYIARVGQFGRVFDQVLEGLAHREELGIVPPRFVIDHVLREMRDLIEPGPTGMVLYTHFTEKLAELEDVDESAAAELAGRLENRAQRLGDSRLRAPHRLLRAPAGGSPPTTTESGSCPTARPTTTGRCAITRARR